MRKSMYDMPINTYAKGNVGKLATKLYFLRYMKLATRIVRATPSASGEGWLCITRTATKPVNRKSINGSRSSGVLAKLAINTALETASTALRTAADGKLLLATITPIANNRNVIEVSSMAHAAYQRIF